MFHYAPGRGAVHATTFLDGYRGRFLQCDGYDAYEKLTAIDRPEGPWQLVHCWTHVRRRFVKRLQNDGSPITERPCARSPSFTPSRNPSAAAPLKSGWRPAGTSPPPMIAAFRPLAGGAALAHPQGLQAGRGHPLHARPLAGADPVPRGWPARVGHKPGGEPNPAGGPDAEKCALRRARGRRRNWAMLASLIATCKMSDVKPVDYIAETLRALLDGHPMSRIETSCRRGLPENIKPRSVGGSARRLRTMDPSDQTSAQSPRPRPLFAPPNSMPSGASSDGSRRSSPFRSAGACAASSVMIVANCWPIRLHRVQRLSSVFGGP